LSSEVPNQVECHLALTIFTLAFHELGQLEREDSVLSAIVTQLEKGDKVGNYSLFKVILNCFSSRGSDPKIVVSDAATKKVFAYFHESPLGGHFGNP